MSNLTYCYILFRFFLRIKTVEALLIYIPDLLSFYHPFPELSPAVTMLLLIPLGFPGGSDGKESACNAGDPGSNPWAWKILWRRGWLPTPVFWPVYNGQRNLVGYSPWVAKSRTQLSD